MLNIYLARHGQNVDNKNGILNGHRDLPLTDKGVAPAHQIADMIEEAKLSFEAIYGSPLVRAFETATIIAGALGGPTPKKDALLIERDFGIMTGKKISDIPLLCGPRIIATDTITYFLDPEGAETFPDLMKRARQLLNKLIELHASGRVSR